MKNSIRKYVDKRECSSCGKLVNGYNLWVQAQLPYGTYFSKKCRKCSIGPKFYFEEYYINFNDEQLEKAKKLLKFREYSLYTLFKFVDFVEENHAYPRFFDPFDEDIQIELMVKWVRESIKKTEKN